MYGVSWQYFTPVLYAVFYRKGSCYITKQYHTLKTLQNVSINLKYSVHFLGLNAVTTVLSKCKTAPLSLRCILAASSPRNCLHRDYLLQVLQAARQRSRITQDVDGRGLPRLRPSPPGKLMRGLHTPQWSLTHFTCNNPSVTPVN